MDIVSLHLTFDLSEESGASETVKLNLTDVLGNVDVSDGICD